MKNILFIVESFKYKPNPNGICAQQVIRELIKRKVNVSVLTTKTTLNQPEFEISESVKIYSFQRSLGESLQLKASTKPKWIKCIYGTFANFIFRFWLVASCGFWPKRSMTLVRNYCKIAEKLIIEDAIDTIISVYMGIDEVEAGFKLKRNHPNLRFMIYTLDAMSARKYPKIFGTDVALHSLLRWERKLFPLANDICVMQSHAKHYEDKKYEEIISKLRIMDIPLLSYGASDVQQRKSGFSNDHKLQIVYTGAALIETGNPLYFIEYVLPKMPMCELHLYGRVDTKIQDKITQHVLFDKRVFIHGMVPFEQIAEIQSSADCLITFGSDNPNMIPCKIFEYFSSLNPVINIYNSENDSAYPYVDKYKCKLQLFTGDPLSYNVSKLTQFIAEIQKGITIWKNDVEKVFWNNTPNPMVELILSDNRFGDLL